jgi:hypothetical protein
MLMMSGIIRPVSALLALSCAACVRTTRDQSPPANAAEFRVRATSYGPITFGAPIEAVNAALGDTLQAIFGDSKTCTQLVSSKLPRGISLMFLRDRVDGPVFVERVNVERSGVRTAEGAQVGDAESAIADMYKGRVRIEPQTNGGPRGRYLVTTTPGDTMHQIIFETDGRSVLRYRAGRRPAVDFIEGCF